MTTYLYQVQYHHIDGHTYDHKGGEYMTRATAYRARQRLEDNPDVVEAWVIRTDQFIVYGPPPPEDIPVGDAARERQELGG